MVKKRIVILTNSELRHTFLRKYIGLCRDIEIVATFCEGLEKNLPARVLVQEQNDLRRRHLEAREQSENDFFRLFVDTVPDNSNPIFLSSGDINTPEYTNRIIVLKPDLLVAYGCSIIKEPLLSAFHRRFLNVHLGLSPYYRGAGTNFWPFVNDEPEYVGATFMHIDAGIDTGEIIHQIRARVFWGDSPHQIGNRLIVDVAEAYKNVILKYDELRPMPQLPKPAQEKYYKNKDFSEESVVKLYESFKNGLVETYLSKREERHARAPIIENSALTVSSARTV